MTEWCSWWHAVTCSDLVTGAKWWFVDTNIDYWSVNTRWSRQLARPPIDLLCSSWVAWHGWGPGGGLTTPASGAANARRVWFLRLWLGVSDKTGPTCLHAIGSNKQTRETKTWSLKQSLTCYSDFLEIQSALTIQERKYSIHKMWTNIKKTLKVHFLSEKVFISK